MTYLILTVFSTTLLFVIFKFFEKYNVNTFQAIVLNYWICVITGLSFSGFNAIKIDVSDLPWITLSAVLGSLFTVTFYLISQTTQKVGVAASSVASKISMVIPVLFSLFVLKVNKDTFNLLNYFGLFLSILAVFLTSYKRNEKETKVKFSVFLLPLAVFALSGIGDVIINYTTATFLTNEKMSSFSIFTFLSSAFWGTLVLIYKMLKENEKLAFRSVKAGVILGIPNYFSIYFLVNAVSAFNNDGAFLFPVNNMSIIMCAMLFGIVAFKEVPSKINLLGILVSLISIFLISYQKLLIF